MKHILPLFLLLSCWAQHAHSQPANPWAPPEYSPSKAVLIEWDFNPDTWSLYSELIRECREAVEAILVVRDQGEENQMRQRLANDGVPLSNLSFVHLPCERMWIRDHGPLAVQTDAGVAFIDLDDLAHSGLDEDLPTNLAGLWGLDAYQLPYIFCGGNFMVDSYHTLFTTTRLYTNNPGYAPAAIGFDFEDYMGITDIVALSPQHNDYWGHIDMQIKLLDDTTLVISSVDPGSGPNFDSLENNYARLAALTAPHGRPYRIARLPMADNLKTYANSLILNHKVLVPIYNHPRDAAALAVYRELLPEHEIVGINCNAIIGWEGAVHCITMQLFDEGQVTAIQSLSLKDKAFEAFPNPIQRGQQLQLLWPATAAASVAVNLYDAYGRLLYSAVSTKRENFFIPWGYPTGAYWVEVRTERGRHFKKIVGL